MIDIKALILCFICLVPACYASEGCTLRVGDHPRELYSFGSFQIAETSNTYIWFSEGSGDILPKDTQERSRNSFNFQTLYRNSNNAGIWYFRFSGASFFSKTRLKRTALYSVEWSDDKWPADPGFYRIDSVDAPRLQVGSKTLATVGDSMTWWADGAYFRCFLASLLPEYRFHGSNTDIFGYGNDGHGGDNTAQILARVDRVPASDVYFVLAGANDMKFTPLQTSQNIAQITSALLAKKKRSHVYVSTLLPRGDEYQDLVLGKNLAIRSWYKNCGCQDNVTLIDTNKAMAKIPVRLNSCLAPDQLHPSIEGYRNLSRLIVAAISRSASVARLAPGSCYNGATSTDRTSIKGSADAGSGSPPTGSGP